MFLRGGIKIFLNSKFIFSTPRAKRDSNCLCLIFEKCILGRVDVLVVIKGYHYRLSIILGLSVKKKKTKKSRCRDFCKANVYQYFRGVFIEVTTQL